MSPLDPISVERMFNNISGRYDLLNDIFSFGLHRYWKRKLLALLNPREGEKWLDLCCGTGDLSLSLSRIITSSGELTGIDSASSVLEIAKRRSFRSADISIQWLQKDVLNTELRSNHFDGVVMSYGLRNLSNSRKGFEEIFRLLKSGGRAGLLDFNKFDESSIGASFQQLYLRNIVVPVSSLFGMKDNYSYLEKSLERFLTGSEQIKMAIDVGFSQATYNRIAFGQMGILILQA